MLSLKKDGKKDEESKWLFNILWMRILFKKIFII